MRKPDYISPTALKLYRDNRDEYYLRYLADTKSPRDGQTQPMSIGSAFDAYVKSDIHTKLFGAAATKGGEYDFENIFVKQVEETHRKWARIHGKHVFDMYKSSGALADIMLELNSAIGTPRFEFELRGEVRSVDKTIDGVVLMGKPDIYFTNKEGVGIIFDWKVNGYCSPHHTSPKVGFVCCKPGWNMHKDCDRVKYKGIFINKATTLDRVEADWAAQLSMYSWLCGEEVGSKFITAVDQIVCNNKGGDWPELRFAQHRLLVDSDYQHRLFNEAKELWTGIQTNHYFYDMTKEESISRCQLLDQRAKEMWEVSDNVEDQMFKTLTNISRTH